MGQIDTAYLPHERRFSVYMHITPNGKRYIGITGRSVNARWHPKNYEDCRAFYKAIQKYGWDSITHHIISVGLTKEEAKNAERFLIEKYRTTDKRFGYNILKGGDISEGISEEGRKRLSEFNKGKTVSEVTKKKQRESLIRGGHTRTVVCYETGERFDSAAEAGRTHGIKGASILSVLDKPERTCGGKHWVSIENLDGYAPAQSKSELKKRKVEVIETGEIFNSTKEAAQHLNTTSACIVNACKGRLRSIKGFHLKYVGENPPIVLLESELDRAKKPKSCRGEDKQSQKSTKAVFSLTSGKLYQSAAQAAAELHVSEKVIRYVCRGITETANGELLRYEEDMGREVIRKSQYKPVKHKQKNPWNGVQVVCLQTGIQYKSLKNASEQTGIERKNISRACENPDAKAGGYNWAYVAGT